MRQQYESDTRTLLAEPVEAFLRLRPLRRSLEAMQEFDQEAPASAVKARARIDARFQTLLTKTALDLWRSLGAFAGAAATRTSGRTGKSAVPNVQTGCRPARTIRQMGAAARLPRPAKRCQDLNRQKRLDTWWRQQRAVNAVLEMEVALRELGLKWFDLTAEPGGQHPRGAQGHLLDLSPDGRVDRGWGAGRHDRAGRGAQLATPDERLRGLAHRIQEEAEKGLAEQSELVRPGRWTSWRSVKPRAAFLAAFETYCRPPMHRIVEQYWEGSAAVGREASRAKEIIDYWREASLAHQGESESAVRRCPAQRRRHARRAVAGARHRGGTRAEAR